MKTQDPKFTIEDNRLHGQSGIVPDDEPLFILRARDRSAVALLQAYFNLCEARGCDEDHLDAVTLRLREFDKFAIDYPDRMKQPDTNLAQMHDAKL